MVTPPTPPTRTDIEHHYDSLDTFYRDTWGDHLHHGYWITGRESPEAAVENLTRTVIDRLQLSPADKLCDIGCGCGALALRIARETQAEVTGLTLSHRQRQVAEDLANQQPAGLPRPVFLCQDWLDNQFPDSSFDAAISIECLSHVSNVETFFSEAARVLRPGGRLVLSDWVMGANAPKWTSRWILEPICRGGHLAQLATLAEIETLASGAGLEKVACDNIGPAVGKTWRCIFEGILRKLFTRSDYRRFLLEDFKRSAGFAFTVIRLIVAYRTRSMDYVILQWRKSDER